MINSFQLSFCLACLIPEVVWTGSARGSYPCLYLDIRAEPIHGYV